MSPDPTTMEARPAEREHLWSLTANARLAVELKSLPNVPRIGYGVGGTIGRMLVVRGPVRFGIELAFDYEAFQGNPYSSKGSDESSLKQFGFSFDLRIEALLGRGLARPWIALGPGLSIAEYSGIIVDTMFLEPSRSGVVAALRTSAGVAFRVWRMIELGPHVELLSTFGGAHLTSGGTLFSPGYFDVGLDLGFRL